MKPSYSNKYRNKYLYLNSYFKKQLRTKVRKNFMSDEEFLGIYNLYINLKTPFDLVFIINMIKTSKVYKHYKTNVIYFTNHRAICHCSVEAYFLQPLLDPKHFDKNSIIRHLTPIMEWLFSHTIHTNSLNSVTFK